MAASLDLLCDGHRFFSSLVGGWAGLSLWLCWYLLERNEAFWPRLRLQIPAMIAAAAISTVGLAPAVAMINGPSRQGEIVVAQIHAFYRLAHHQTPHLFWASQHIAGVCSLTLFTLTTLALAWTTRHYPSDTLRAAQRLTLLGWMSLGISAVGLVIDLVGVRIRPDITAGLLRFYWFRWSDIMVPLAWVSTAWVLCLYWQNRSTAAATPPKASLQYGGLVLCLALSFALLGTGWKRVSGLMSTGLAPADQTLLMSESSTLASGPEVVEEWLAVAIGFARTHRKMRCFSRPAPSRPSSGTRSEPRSRLLRMCPRMRSR